MSHHISTQLRNISRFSSLRAITSPSHTSVAEPKKESDNSADVPDFSTLPPDTSSIPANSPYYLYNRDPDTMSGKYMSRMASVLRKKNLMKLKPNLKKEKDTLPREQNSTNTDTVPKQGKHRYTLFDVNALPHNIAVDFSYSHLMNPVEMKSAAVQLIHMLNENSTCRTPLQVHITNYQGCIMDHMLNLGKKMSPKHVHISPFHFTEVFPRDKVVYLSPDSNNVLDRVDPSLVYTIGGLVDARSNIVGASIQAATDAGVRHARLPLKELVITNMCRPLPINRVYEILLNFVLSKDWLRALSDTLHCNNLLAVKLRLPLTTHSSPSSEFPDNYRNRKIDS